MDEETRKRNFKENLLKITQEGGHGNFVIFEELGTRKFVQFAGEMGKENVLCDIPIGGLNQLDEDAVVKLVKMGFSKGGRTFDTCQKRVNVGEAVVLTEKVFREVFGFQQSYEIHVTLNLEDARMEKMKRLREYLQKMEAYSNARPSGVTEVYWIYARRKSGEYPRSTKRSGKWLVFVDIKNVDEVWAKIKKATEEGKLGSSAKVATAKPNPNATDPNTKVICVYTYDWIDEKDVKRVREELRKLGIVNKISYKADEDTLSGKYRVRGHTRISKYYE